MTTKLKSSTRIYDATSHSRTNIQSNLPALISKSTATARGATLHTRPAAVRGSATFVRNSSELQITTLTDISVSDRVGSVGRFTVKYSFLSTALNARRSLAFSVKETATVPSLVARFFCEQPLFASAGWLEREVWDLFGIYFSEHGDLRRILTDYGFAGHPLRKDFPLTGFHELSYNDAEGRVTIEPVELTQELRVFRVR